MAHCLSFVPGCYLTRKLAWLDQLLRLARIIQVSHPETHNNILKHERGRGVCVLITRIMWCHSALLRVTMGFQYGEFILALVCRSMQALSF